MFELLIILIFVIFYLIYLITEKICETNDINKTNERKKIMRDIRNNIICFIVMGWWWIVPIIEIVNNGSMPLGYFVLFFTGISITIMFFINMPKLIKEFKSLK